MGNYTDRCCGNTKNQQVGVICHSWGIFKFDLQDLKLSPTVKSEFNYSDVNQKERRKTVETNCILEVPLSTFVTQEVQSEFLNFRWSKLEKNYLNQWNHVN